MTLQKATLNPALREFWATPARNRVLHGGRMSSKSWDAAGFAIFLASNYRVRFLCTRQFQNKISESVYTLLKTQIERFGLRHEFDITATSIKHKTTGSEFLFYGLWRHIDEIKSTEGVDVLWIEEAHNLTKNQWKILQPTIRTENSQVWIIFNPNFSTDFVYERFVVNPPADTIVRQINYTENQFLNDTALKLIAAAEAEDYEEFQHVYLGMPNDDDDKSVIKRSWVLAAIDAHKTIIPSSGDWFGGKTVGYDVADEGRDLNATTSMDGSVCVALDEWKGGADESMKSSKRALMAARMLGASYVGYDSIGVGANTGSNINALQVDTPRRQRIGHFKFIAGAKVAKPEQKYKKHPVTNKDFFSNLKAQAAWTVADRFLNTYVAVTQGKQFAADDMISISSDCSSKFLNKITTELSTPNRAFDKTGKVMVESKEDLEKREIDSPNLNDSFIIANSRGLLGRRMLRESN